MAAIIEGREGRLSAARSKHKVMPTRQLRALALGPRPEDKPVRFTAPNTNAPVPFIATLAMKRHAK
jgi:hypothetical protein